jgi:hypothetical protein
MLAVLVGTEGFAPAGGAGVGTPITVFMLDMRLLLGACKDLLEAMIPPTALVELGPAVANAE